MKRKLHITYVLIDVYNTNICRYCHPSKLLSSPPLLVDVGLDHLIHEVLELVHCANEIDTRRKTYSKLSRRLPL